MSAPFTSTAENNDSWKSEKRYMAKKTILQSGFTVRQEREQKIPIHDHDLKH